MKRNIILTLLVISTIVLVGCKSIDINVIPSESTPGNTVEFTRAVKNMDTQINYQMKMKMNLIIDNEKTTVEMATNIDMLNENEGQMELSVATSYNGSVYEVNGYTILDKDIITTYLHDSSTDQWVKTTMTPEEFQGEELSFDLPEILKTVYLRKEVLEDGTKCDVFALQIDDISYLTSLLGDNLDILSSMGISEHDFAYYFSNVKFEIYVDSDNSLIRQMYMDLTEVMNKCTSKLDVSVSKFDITIELNNFGNVHFDIPISEIEALLNQEDNPTDPVDNPEQPYNYNNLKTTFKFDTIYKQLQYESNVIPLPFKVTDSVAHPTEPIIYFTSSVDMALYEVNYSNGAIRTIYFDFAPERLTYHNDKIYVTLLKGNHSSYWWEEQQEGAIAVVNASSMTLDKQFEIDIDPFDIEVDKDGIIYVPGGSGQWTNFVSYNEIGLPISQTGIRQLSFIKYNDKFNKIYSITTDSSPRDLDAFNLSKGKYTATYDSPYHGDYQFNTIFEISPDGKYIFNGSGVILLCSPNKDEDLNYKAKLNYAFDDITFDLGRNNFYTSHGNQMLKYNYLNNEILGFYKTYAKINDLYFSNDNVVVIGKDNLNNYYIEILKEDKGPIPEKPNPEEVTIDGDSSLLNFTVTDSVQHPTKDILYFSSSVDRTLYEYNHQTNIIRSVEFSLPPESITFRNNKIYVNLLKGAHNSCWWNEEQEGAFAVINADTMEIEKQFDINIDPFDIEADTDGNIYITSGSGQWTRIVKYNSEGIIQNTGSIYERNHIVYNPILNRVYTVDMGVSPTDIHSFNPDLKGTDSPYHGDYRFDTNIYITPDGAYLINGSGVILKTSNNPEQDMRYLKTLEYSFETLTFDIEKNLVLAAKDNGLFVFDLTTFDLISYSRNNNKIKSLFYSNGKLYALTEDKQRDYRIECLTVPEK